MVVLSRGLSTVRSPWIAPYRKPTGALLNLFCGMLGPGFLSLPLAFKMAGLWAGLGLVFLVGGLCLLSMYRLVQCSQSLVEKTPGIRCLSYGDTVGAAIDHSIRNQKAAKIGRFLADGCVAAFQFGVLVVSFVFASEHLPDLLSFIGIENPSRALPLYLILQIILCFSGSLRLLTVLATLGNIVILAVVVIFAKEMVSRGFLASSSLPDITNVGGVATAAGALIYALEGQTMILPLENRLTDRKSMLGLNGVLCTSINLVIILYAATGFFGYLCFGDAVRGSISLNLPGNTASRIVQTLLVGKIFVGTALQVHVFKDVFCPPGREKSVGRILGPVVIVVTGLIAMLVPHLSLVIPLVGLTSGLALSLLFPPFIHLLMTFSKEGRTYSDTLLACLTDFGMIFIGFYFLGTGLVDYASKLFTK